MRIDAHQHFWRLARGDYGWLTPDLAPIYLDFGPGDLAPLLAEAGIDGTVLVQAAPTVAETEYLLEIAAARDFVLGVVGWVPFGDPAAPETLARLSESGRLVGVRPMIQDIADDDWMLRPDLAPAFGAVRELDLSFDALVLPRHLPRLRRLLERHPDLRVVIDHGAKPEIRAGRFDGWAADMRALAEGTGAYCKLSGLVTEAAAEWSAADLRPYVEHLLESFGPDRLIWGSDWPVLRCAGDYAGWLATAEALVGGDAAARAAIFGGTAQQAYRLVAEGAEPV